MDKVIAAGGIVVKHNPNKQVLLTIFSHIDGLGLPKGHVEEGETLEQAAIREVTEETGLTKLTIVKKLGVYSKIATEREGQRVSKDIHIYFMNSESLDFHQKAEENYGWFDIEEAVERIADVEDREFLKSILDLI